LNLDANWTYGADGFCHSPGAADNAEMTITPDLLGITKYIQVNFTVTNFTQGAVTLNFDTDPTQSVTANGEYSFYFDVTTGGATNDLKIIADSDFDGCIEITSIYQLRKDYIAIIRNYSDDTFVADASSALDYTQDFVTLSASLVEYNNLMAAGGCYKVCISDPCTPVTVGNNLVVNGGFDNTNVGTELFAWARNDGAGNSASDSYGNNRMQVEDVNGSEGSALYLYQQINNIDETATFLLRIDIGQILQVSTPYKSTTNIYIVNGAGDKIVPLVFNKQNGVNDGIWTFSDFDTTLDIQLDDLSGNGGSIYGSWELVIYPSYWIAYGGGLVSGIHIRPIGTAAGWDDIYYDNIELNEPAFVESCSDCIAVETDHDCSKLISASATGNKLGFNFDAPFELQQRLRFLKFNPTYNIDGNDYSFSNGDQRIHAGSRKKYYEGLIDYVGETEHDTLSTQIICDTLTIDGVEFHVKPEDYKPEWDKSGGQQLAQARIQLMKQGTNLKNSKCE
jgi:hypothetical protein